MSFQFNWVFTPQDFYELLFSKNNCLKILFFTPLRFLKLLIYKYPIILVNNLNNNLSYGRNTEIQVTLNTLYKYFSQ